MHPVIVPDTDPVASPAREPSPYLVALARAYILAPTGSAGDGDLERLVHEVCEEQDVCVDTLLGRDEFEGLEPEERR